VPYPTGFVVKKGSINLFAISGGIPGPDSLKNIIIVRVSWITLNQLIFYKLQDGQINY
jgi:hypothetical protein